jgi:hypothetical protein
MYLDTYTYSQIHVYVSMCIYTVVILEEIHVQAPSRGARLALCAPQWCAVAAEVAEGAETPRRGTKDKWSH